MPSIPRRPPMPLHHDAGRRQAVQRLFTTAAAAVAGLPLASAHAQAAAASGGWPDRPIRLVHPWAAGGGGDIVARLLAERMQPLLGQPVVVDNRTGAGGNIGAQFAARQAADGYTVMTTAGGFAIAPSLFRSLGYDPVKDFVPVTKMATAPLLVLVRADSPLRSMADLVALARKEPQGVSFASFGIGSPSHLMGESINRLAGITMTHVPYSSGNAGTDLMGGQVTLAILDALSQTPQVKAGKLRALALNGTARLPSLPDVPTLAELGIPFELVGWHGMFAPAGTPRAVVDRLNRVVNQIIALPEVKGRLFDLALFPVQPPTTPEQWGAMFRQDVQSWGELVRSAGIQPT
ncbi:tripartite tricarboxylate transporter substrate binding protein [Pseudorhodoferax sp. Leaf265]|uniref:Bug family tripartite tricarboxylate transporter substrate binding protein n=1 Tax=Pseudorhodoferax sp. Leaf265 TaxID=1736315 RepID=UPI000AF2C993|nr:tripartite tricarboxylate transporter substrate binding protein [Pseudorhodoferax sp. Leaf265]